MKLKRVKSGITFTTVPLGFPLPSSQNLSTSPNPQIPGTWHLQKETTPEGDEDRGVNVVTKGGSGHRMTTTDTMAAMRNSQCATTGCHTARYTTEMISWPTPTRTAERICSMSLRASRRAGGGTQASNRSLSNLKVFIRWRCSQPSGIP